MKKVLFLAIALVTLSTLWALNNSDDVIAAPVGDSSLVVEVVTVEKQVLFQKVPLIGTVFAINSVEIKPESEGKIKSINVKSGQVVKEGSILIQLDNRHQLAVVKREQARLIDYERQYQKYRDLMDKGAVTQTTLDSAETQLFIQQAELSLAQADLQDKTIIAPFSGRVGLVDLSRGQLISQDTILTTLDDASQLRLNVPIATRHIHLLQKQQQIEISSAELQGQTQVATLNSIDSRVNSQNLNVLLQFNIDNRNMLLTPGSLVTSHIQLSKKAEVLVPLQSIVYEGHQRFVYRVENDSVKKIEVTLGERNDKFVQVLTGLSPADTIVYRGTVKLHDGAQVEIKL